MGNTRFRASGATTRGRRALQCFFRFRDVNKIPSTQVFIQGGQRLSQAKAHHSSYIIRISRNFTIFAFGFRNIHPNGFARAICRFRFATFNRAHRAANRLDSGFLFPNAGLISVNFQLTRSSAIFDRHFNFFSGFHCIRRHFEESATSIRAGATRNIMAFCSSNFRAWVDTARNDEMAYQTYPGCRSLDFSFDARRSLLVYVQQSLIFSPVVRQIILSTHVLRGYWRF